MSFWRRLGSALAQPPRYAALAGGVLPVLCFPAPSLGFLAWVVLVPGLLLMRAAPSAREAAVRGWWFGAGFIMAAHYWLLPNIGPALLLVALALGALWAGVGVSPGALPGGAGGGAELLAAGRVDPVLAGARRPVGATRRQPVAAPGDARAGQRRRRLAGQLRPGGGEYRHRDPGHCATGRAAGGRRGGGGRRGRGRPAGVRAHPRGAPGGAGDRGPGPARLPGAPLPAGHRQPAADRRAGPAAPGPYRVGGKQHR